MTETYAIDLHFREEDISDEEYDAILQEIEELEDDVEIISRKEDRKFDALSADPATVVALNAALLAVHGTDILLTVYQIARNHPAFASVLIQDESGERVETLTRDHIEAGEIDEDVIIGTVEGDVNIGDVFLVAESDVDWLEIAQGADDGEE
jgi:hypothetical protein